MRSLPKGQVHYEDNIHEIYYWFQYRPHVLVNDTLRQVYDRAWQELEQIYFDNPSYCYTSLSNKQQKRMEHEREVSKLEPMQKKQFMAFRKYLDAIMSGQKQQEALDDFEGATGIDTVFVDDRDFQRYLDERIDGWEPYSEAAFSLNAKIKNEFEHFMIEAGKPLGSETSQMIDEQIAKVDKEIKNERSMNE